MESALQGTVSSDLIAFEAALKKKHEEITKQGAKLVVNKNKVFIPKISKK